MNKTNSPQPFVATKHPAYRAGLVDLSAADAKNHARLVMDIFEDRVLGAIVRNVFDRQTVATLVDALGMGKTNVPRVPSEHYGGASYGEMLIVTQDLESYFASASHMQGLAANGIDIEGRLRDVLGSLAQGLSLQLAHNARGQRYSAVTVRVVEPGGSIDVHCENETVGFPNMGHLRTLIDDGDQISFYTPLILPEGGGELAIHPLRYEEPSGRPLRERSRKLVELGPDLAPLNSIVPNVGVGDLLLFDAGRYFHGVSPVMGPQARWTMGGFLARAKAGDHLVYWS